MRKLLVLIAVAAMAVGLFSPAEAARKKSFSISLNPSPSGTASTYNDTSLDLSSTTSSKGRTTIRAKVKGGKVAGKKVSIYATNMNTQARTRTSLGSAKISKSGYITKAFTPGSGHAGTYKIEIVKKSGGGYKAKTKTFYIRTFQFVSLATFYNAAASTPGLVQTVNRETVNGTKWGESYRFTGSGTAVYSIQGYQCFFFNLKIGVWDESRTGGSYSVSQAGRGVIMAAAKAKGGGFDEPTMAQGKSVSGAEPLLITTTGEQATSFILGNPKISCTFPTKLAATPF